MTQREKLLEKFNTEYNRLNEQQKKAVDQVYGPVMVVAGPGTGKTQILSVRIGKILLETDYLPSNILCLTYTDAGVLAMRKRLLGLIGPDAYSVNLHSYHSFCNSVIQQHRHLFHKRDLQPINELEQLQALMKLIDSFEDSNPLKRYKTDAYFEAAGLRGLFSAMKREGWRPEWLTKKIEEYIEDGLYNDYANKIKLRKGIVELTQKGRDEIEKLQKLKAAVQAFPLYQQLLKDSQRYDFDDMINWVIDAFGNHPDLLLGYQEQYQFILVDEYQDTSGSQNALVEQLISYWQDESPNIFVVGDDDQSIYRFQGANMENMMLLARKYEKDLLRVVLTDNYRSVQPILDAAGHLIGNNTQRLVNEYKDLQKVLKASREEHKDLHIAPVVRSVANEFEENILVAEEIKALIDEGTKPGCIAVIYKEHKTGEELQKFLQLQGVPVYVKRSVNLLKEGFIKKILTFLKYVAAENFIPYSGDHLLFNILHFDFYKIPPLKVASISNEIFGKRGGTASNLRTYLAQLGESTKSKLFSSDEYTDKLVQVHNVLEKLIADSQNLPLLKWLEGMINEAGILSYIMQQPDKATHMRMLNAFFDYVQDECRRNPDLTLAGLMDQIALLEENAISLPLVQTTGNEQGVNLLSCHGSKGLEYTYVFFMGCYSGLWEGKRKPSQGYKLPPTVFQKESREEAEEELRRLFFVAATRAEKYLYLSFPKFTNEGKPLEASRFLAEMNAEDNLKVEPITISEEIKLKYSALRYGLTQQPLLEAAEKDFINELLKNFKMNVTALNNYLDCPVKFYYASLIRVPSAINESAQFGSSMHDALNFYYNKMMEEKQYPGKTVLLSRFQWHITQHREVFTPQSLKRFTDYGVQCLTAFYAQFFEEGARADFIRTEVPMEAVINEIPLKGFADKIEYWGNDILITDFKTGSLEKSSKRYEFAEPYHPQKEQGGNHWRQAVFYKILSDNLKGKTKNLQGIEFLFIEPNGDGGFDKKLINIKPEHEEIVKAQIRDTWEKIQDHDFYTGCGKPECRWCEFVKEHKLYVSLLEGEEVAEEPVNPLRMVE
ncbi:MAG TPA: ATP-dependent DNA helicase [Chitinophagaceae bacterium]|nr:ATP-dependent DNA helicase [Chitinophagaceae bacterium]